MADYQGKKVVIIGLGLTGLSCVDFFLARGVTPRVMDTRVSPPGLDKLPEQIDISDTPDLLPPLALCAPDGTDSEEIRRIYHRRA